MWVRSHTHTDEKPVNSVYVCLHFLRCMYVTALFRFTSNQPDILNPKRTIFINYWSERWNGSYGIQVSLYETETTVQWIHISVILNKM